MQSAAIVRNCLVIVGECPTASAPYVAEGKTPVPYRAFALLFFLDRYATLFALVYALAKRVLTPIIVRLAPPVRPVPKSLAAFPIFARMPHWR